MIHKYRYDKMTIYRPIYVQTYTEIYIMQNTMVMGGDGKLGKKRKRGKKKKRKITLKKGKEALKMHLLGL